ncbi:MAG: ABC transporter permease [Acidimicrobiia bacterium]|nr:ABC transporter permease [Acidimicrobiia bacterium]
MSDDEDTPTGARAGAGAGTGAEAGASTGAGAGASGGGGAAPPGPPPTRPAPASPTSANGGGGVRSALRSGGPAPRVEPGDRGRDLPAIWAVMRKDLTAIRRSKSITLPMIIVPTLLVAIMPFALGSYARAAPPDQVANALRSPLARSLLEPISSLPEDQQLPVLILGYLLSPVLLVIPLMVSAVLAADAFAGEKERRTLETLLHLPVADRDLFLAKVLVAFVPAVAITWAGAAVYAGVSNLVAWPVTGRIILPFGQWLAVMGWVAPAIALLALGALVFVSSRARTTQEANQLGGVVILPLIFVAASQASALLLAPLVWVFVVGGIIWMGALALVGINARRFTRDRLASRS